MCAALSLFIFIFQCLRTIIAPLLWWVLPFLPFCNIFRDRKCFEARNKPYQSKIKANYCFHFSSVGELEQCMPIIKELLKNNKYLELIYTSDSVEGRVKKLLQKYPQQISSFALPILGFNLLTRNIDKIITADHITMVRYDFFPELLISAKNRKSILLSSTFIGKKINFLRKFYFRYIFSCFDHVITATNDDGHLLQKHFGIESTSLELRIGQILDRINNIPKCFNEIKKFDKNHIIGSVWPRI